MQFLHYKAKHLTGLKPAEFRRQCLSLQFVQVVSRAPFEISALIMQRNMLAAQLIDLQRLPAMVQDERSCNNCFQKVACMALHKV